MGSTSNLVSKKVVAALAILCIVALVGLNFSLVSYWNGMNAKKAEIQTLTEQNVALQEQIINLTTTPKSKLVALGMQYTDNRTNSNACFLQVTGYIVNVGAITAINCTIHISATQNDNNTAIDASAPVKSLEPGEYEKIDVQFSYTGQPLVAFSAILNWLS